MIKKLWLLFNDLSHLEGVFLVNYYFEEVLFLSRSDLNGLRHIIFSDLESVAGLCGESLYIDGQFEFMFPHIGETI